MQNRSRELNMKKDILDDFHKKCDFEDNLCDAILLQFNKNIRYDYTIPEGVTLDIIWEKLWASPPPEFTLEYGAEYVDEAIQDWMIDNDFIVVLDNDNWLDDEDSDVESDDVQLNME
jgi:hypothetical protein